VAMGAELCYKCGGSERVCQGGLFFPHAGAGQGSRQVVMFVFH